MWPFAIVNGDSSCGLVYCRDIVAVEMACCDSGHVMLSTLECWFYEVTEPSIESVEFSHLRIVLLLLEPMV